MSLPGPHMDAGLSSPDRPKLGQGRQPMRYNIRDVPDKWKSFDPERPPYRFWPNRSRAQTAQMSFGTMMGGLAVIWIGKSMYEKKMGETEAEAKKNGPRYFSNYIEEAGSMMDEQMRRTAERSQRDRLGIPVLGTGSCEIRDNKPVQIGNEWEDQKFKTQFMDLDFTPPHIKERELQKKLQEVENARIAREKGFENMK